MSAEVRIDASRLERMLRLPGGPGARLLRRRADRVAARARVLGARHGSMGRFVQDPVVSGSGRGLTAVIECTHPATRFVLFGTRPHLIRPRRARALRFEVEGQQVFAQLVRHPGTRADNFMEQALRDVL
jgi:hypothetical protein